MNNFDLVFFPIILFDLAKSSVSEAKAVSGMESLVFSTGAELNF